MSNNIKLIPQKEVDVVVACDEFYLPHAATMLCSLLEKNSLPIRINLLHNGINTRKLIRLEKFLENYGAKFKDFEIHDVLLSSLKLTRHFSTPTYFRLLIPEILSVNTTKVLYFDCDLIVRKPIDTLWKIDLNDSLLAAVEDNVYPNYKERLGLHPNLSYFNSGVLLINLEQWRLQSFHIKVIDYIKNHPNKLTFPDQDGLNVVADGNWIKLPTIWNVQHAYFFRPGYAIRYADIIADPEIVHFTGTGLKPWQNTKTKHPYASEYHKYRQITPWKKYKLENWPRRSAIEEIKELAKNILRFIGKSNIAWKINDYIYRLADFMRNSRENKAQERAPQIKNLLIDEIKSLIPKQEVISGPFKGLKYPRLEAVCSTIAPKLLGTYEIELQQIVEEICREKYSTIINIGCAEGYYAVGLALRMPNANVYAYDINQKARQLCREMALANGVRDRVKIQEYFTMRSIQTIINKDQGIIFCDCEGAEEYIFYKDGEDWDNIIKHYNLIIEIHDMIRSGISAYIYDLFSESHNIKIIYGVSDLLRPRIYDCPILQGKSNDTKEELMAEIRSGETQWFYMKRKNLK
jgi:lipopolysaccharide biosynthesis glycosyltransferase